MCKTKRKRPKPTLGSLTLAVRRWKDRARERKAQIEHLTARVKVLEAAIAEADAMDRSG